MADATRPGGRGRRFVTDDDPPANDDFLFHLSRGSELLVQNRVVEAKEELERALALRPQDAQGQDLLAGVYFRLGVYPTAIELWCRLAEQFPDDPTLHVNLGLAYFKTGQPEDAREHLERALALDPDHERAWGYLGLTLWRLGRANEAREAFLRGGQVSMARRMEAEMHSTAPPARSAAPPVEDAEVSAMKDAAGEAVQRLATASLSLERQRSSRPSGSWRVLETGADPIPRPPTTSIVPLSPPDLTAMAESWAVKLPKDQPLAVGAEGELLV
ncbi:MAG TPA: tetratricopeptide repeat protein, partial [Sandaracinaceae bacterium]